MTAPNPKEPADLQFDGAKAVRQNIDIASPRNGRALRPEDKNIANRWHRFPACLLLGWLINTLLSAPPHPREAANLDKQRENT